MLREPTPEDKGIDPIEMKTSEQKEKKGTEETAGYTEKAERLEKFKPVAEGLLDHYFEEW